MDNFVVHTTLTAPLNPVMFSALISNAPLSLLKIAALVPFGTLPPLITTVAALADIEPNCTAALPEKLFVDTRQCEFFDLAVPQTKGQRDLRSICSQ